MFDHCDSDTLTVINSAVEEAAGLGHDYLGTEHLLLALVQQRDLLPKDVVGLLPGAPGAVRTAIARKMGSLPYCDAQLLRSVGIDLAEVRAAVRQTFGDEALTRLGRRRPHRPWRPWRRPIRRCTSLLAGTTSVAPRLKESLERARHDAHRRQRSAIDPAALLLGMVEVDDAMANRLLREAGHDPCAIRRALR